MTLVISGKKYLLMTPQLCYIRSPRSSRASDEHVFPAIVSKRLSCEATVERFQLETGNVDEPEPLVLGCPPERARRAIVECQVDPIVPYGIPDGMGRGSS